MELTMQYVHSYQILANKNMVPSIEELIGNKDELLLPELNENNQVIFKNLYNKEKIIPGINLIEKIIYSVESNKEFLKITN